MCTSPLASKTAAHVYNLVYLTLTLSTFCVRARRVSGDSLREAVCGGAYPVLLRVVLDGTVRAELAHLQLFCELRYEPE